MLLEVAGHSLHMALFGAGLVVVAALLWASRPGSLRRRGRRGEQARVRALRESARAGTLGSAPSDPDA